MSPRILSPSGFRLRAPPRLVNSLNLSPCLLRCSHLSRRSLFRPRLVWRIWPRISALSFLSPRVCRFNAHLKARKFRCDLVRSLRRNCAVFTAMSVKSPFPGAVKPTRRLRCRSFLVSHGNSGRLKLSANAVGRWFESKLSRRKLSSRSRPKWRNSAAVSWVSANLRAGPRKAAMLPGGMSAPCANGDQIPQTRNLRSST